MREMFSTLGASVAVLLPEEIRACLRPRNLYSPKVSPAATSTTSASRGQRLLLGSQPGVGLMLAVSLASAISSVRLAAGAAGLSVGWPARSSLAAAAPRTFGATE